MWITILVPGKSETVIPVSCLEQGRWHYRPSGGAGHRSGPWGAAGPAAGSPTESASAFAACHAKVSPSMRAAASRDISSSLKRGRGFEVNQEMIWDRVKGLSNELGVDSPSSAYLDAAESRRSSIEDLLPRFRPLAGQSGAMVVIGGKLAGAEIAGSPETYAKLHRKILSPYLFDAIVMRAKLETPSGEKADAMAEAMAEEAATAGKAGRFWLAAISDAPCELRPSVGLGRDFRMESQAIVGGGLENDGRVVYLSAFARAGLM